MEAPLSNVNVSQTEPDFFLEDEHPSDLVGKMLNM